ncbi:MAG: RsmB/NOP family class I SAM-dependent RNA methyltransferase [Phycisphaerae bacterium]|nr:transcription antitermination factor NusB [Tepidisphaeraceae bacterium]
MTSRDYALHEIDAKALPNWPAGKLRRNRPAKPGDDAGTKRPAGGDVRPPTDSRDLALAEQITVGVVKNVLYLQHLAQHYSGRSLKSIDPLVQKILAVGLYQLKFLTRVPASAAVDEAVEQAKRFGQPRAAGFVNAVLRKATRDPAPELPDPNVSAMDYARLGLSHPAELFKKLVDLLGEDDALEVCAHDQLEPPVIVRMDDAERFAATFGAKPREAGGFEFESGVVLAPHEAAGMFVVTGAKRAVLGEWARAGVAQVQDPTAAGVVAMAQIEAGQVVLDRCAGLGTKTMQMRLAAGEDGRVLAMDPNEARCEGLRRLLGERGATNVDVHAAAWLRDIRDRAGVPAQFDRVVADVPCSNSGVMARRPEARYHQSERALKSLAELQDRILEDSAPLVAPGGILVYSTCSVWPEENRMRVDAFCERHAEFEPVEEKGTLPSFGEDPAAYHDGGYYAVLRKKA